MKFDELKEEGVAALKKLPLNLGVHHVDVALVDTGALLGQVGHKVNRNILKLRVGSPILLHNKLQLLRPPRGENGNQAPSSFRHSVSDQAFFNQHRMINK